MRCQDIIFHKSLLYGFSTANYVKYTRCKPTMAGIANVGAGIAMVVLLGSPYPKISHSDYIKSVYQTQTRALRALKRVNVVLAGVSFIWTWSLCLCRFLVCRGSGDRAGGHHASGHRRSE